jgi:hypothetical protein
MLVGGAAVAGLAGAWRLLAHRRHPISPDNPAGPLTELAPFTTKFPGPVLAANGASVKSFASAGHWRAGDAQPPRNDGPGFGPGAALLSIHEPPTG